MPLTDNAQLEADPAHRSKTNQTGRPGGRIGMLDGLRGLALVAVVLYHVSPTGVPGGFLGVEAFFVLSGYLLTSLLLDEAKGKGRIDRRAYALRRLRRIGPALAVLLAWLVVLGPWIAPADVYRLRGDVLSSLSGLTNWRLIADGDSYFNQVGRPPLVRHLWSIAVEIQFYLLCPFLVMWILRRKRFSAIASIAAGLIASSAAMAILYSSPDPSRAYYGTDTRAGGLLAGVLLAVLLGYRMSLPPDPSPGVWLQRIGFGSMVILGLLVVFGDQGGRLMYPGGFLLTQIATMLIVAAGLRSGPVASFLDRRVFRWLGERCYGIYLWHWPAVVLLRPGLDVQWPPLVAGTVSIAIALVMGDLSLRCIEKLPARKPRPRPRHAAPRKVHPLFRPALTALALVPVVLLALRLPTTNPIAESLREGERVVARQSGGRAALILTPVGASSGAAPAGDIVRRVTAIGDSVMVGAAGALGERLGPLSFIEAKLSRQFSEGISTIQSLRQTGALGDVAVVHLGNNGPVKGRQIDVLMNELAGFQNVLLVTVRVSQPWAESVNQAYAEAASRFPRVKIVDWNAFSAGHPEWFQSDGNHLKPSGARAYSDLIAGVLRTLPAPPAPPPPPPAPPPAPAAPHVAAPPAAAATPPAEAPPLAPGPGGPALPPAGAPTIILGA